MTSQWRQTWLCRDHLQFCRNLTIEAAGLAAEMAFPKDLAAGALSPLGNNTLKTSQHPLDKKIHLR
ncbi:MAG: hypothetical protein P8X65_13345 [Syntrophobacterales bacterium]